MQIPRLRPNWTRRAFAPISCGSRRSNQRIKVNKWFNNVQLFSNMIEKHLFCHDKRAINITKSSTLLWNSEILSRVCPVGLLLGNVLLPDEPTIFNVLHHCEKNKWRKQENSNVSRFLIEPTQLTCTTFSKIWISKWLMITVIKVYTRIFLNVVNPNKIDDC